MTIGTYMGPIEHLRGQKALLRRATHATVVAQFADCGLRRDTAERFDPWSNEIKAVPWDALGYGWHAFPTSDFQIDMCTTSLDDYA